MSFELLLMRLVLRWRSRQGPLRRRARRIRASGATYNLQVGEVRVAAVQMSFRFVKSAAEFFDIIAAKMAAAHRQGAEIVVFPEDVGTMLLGLLPGFSRLEAEETLEDALKTLGEDVQAVDLLELAGPAARRVYEATFQTLAKVFSMVVAAGSVMLPTRDGRVRNVGYLYGPGGKLLTQPKNHLLPLEFDWGLAVGDDLEVVQSPYGRLAMPICMDASFFETFRILEAKGTDIALLPVADPTPVYSDFKALRGIWPRVQESRLYGVSANMVGGALGLHFAGKSGIYAPLELTPEGDGIIAQAKSATDEELVVGNVDVLALRRLREESPRRFEEKLYERYFPEIYQGHWRGGAEVSRGRAHGRRAR